MIDQLTDLIQRTRQHHGIEHATIHILTARHPGKRFSGLSDPLGFTILGEVSESDLRRGVGDALLRMQAGESHLAIHPNCGTNLTTTVGLVSLAALLGGAGKRDTLDKISSTMILVTAALLTAPKLGMFLQNYTTSAAVSDRWVEEIRPFRVAGKPAFRVNFSR
jgi:hypothetical protein